MFSKLAKHNIVLFLLVVVNKGSVVLVLTKVRVVAFEEEGEKALL